MSDDKPGNVLPFQRKIPSSTIKRLEDGNKRQSCRHMAIDVGMDEPVIECRDCGAVVDPYQWIRLLTFEWTRFFEEKETKKRQMEREIADLEQRIRTLRGEYNGEAERRDSERAIAVLPPQSGRRPWKGKG